MAFLIVQFIFSKLLLQTFLFAEKMILFLGSFPIWQDTIFIMLRSY